MDPTSLLWPRARAHPQEEARAFFNRLMLARTLCRLAAVALGLAVFLIAFRYRFLLQTYRFEGIYKDYTDLLLFAFDLPVLGALVLWLISLAIHPRRLKWGPPFLSIPLAGLLLASLVSIPSSVDRTVSIYHAIRLLGMAGLYLFIVNEIRSAAALVVPAALQIFIQSAVALAQVIRQHSLGLTSVQELELDPAWHGVSIVNVYGTRLLRAYGLSDHPNILGGCLTFALLLMMVWYMEQTSREPGDSRGRAFWRPVVACAFGSGAVALFLTFSRAAWLGLAFGLIVGAALLLWQRHRRALLASFGLIGAGMVLALPFIWIYSAPLGVRVDWNNSFSSIGEEARSIHERVDLAGTAAGIFLRRPLTGVGLAAFPIALKEEVPGFPGNYQPPHLVALDVAAETGVAGLVSYLAAVFAPSLALLAAGRRGRITPALAGISALLAACSVISLLDYYPWLLGTGLTWQTLIWGLWAVTYSSGVEQNG